MSKILVTGATGFIGNHVINELLKNNFEVIASSSDYNKACKYPWYSKVTYKELDLSTINDNINYYSYFNTPDVIIHLAWEGLPNYKDSFHEDINLPRHSWFIQNLVQNGATNINITGTCFEYGMQEGMLHEQLDVFPNNAYARAKNKLRKQIESLQANYHFCFKWIRLFYMYGNGQSPKSLLSLLDAAIRNGDKEFNMSGGEQVRDYLPVENVAELIVKISLQTDVTGIINCCSGNPITIKELVKKYLQSIHQDIQLNLGYYPYPDYEPMSFWGDITKLNTILNTK